MHRSMIIAASVLAVGGTDWAQNARPSASPEHFDYSGGSGKSIGDAVVIRGAVNDAAGDRAVNAYLNEHYPGYNVQKQSYVRRAAKSYDLLEIKTASGEMRKVYFNITDSFGK